MISWSNVVQKEHSHESKMICDLRSQLVNQGEVIQNFRNKLLIIQNVVHNLNTEQQKPKEEREAEDTKKQLLI